jgi:tetratricopeptide (TPR) repeat protein
MKKIITGLFIRVEGFNTPPFRARLLIGCFVVILMSCSSIYYAVEGAEAEYYKDYDSAIKYYTKAIRRSPDYAVSRYYTDRADAYLKKGEFDMAISDYTKVIELEGYGNSYYRRGLAYEKKGDFELAIVDYSKALSITKDGLVDEEYYRNDGEGVYEATRKIKISDKLKAVKELLAESKVPDSAKEAASRGLTAYNSKNYDRALAEYAEAVNIYQDFFPFLYGLALTCHDMGQYDLAITWFTKALGIEPDNIDAKNKLAAATSMKNAETYIAQGKGHEEKKDYANAIAAYRKAVVASPGYAAAKQYLAAAFDKRIAENKTVYPSPFEGKWKYVISPAYTIPAGTETYYETETRTYSSPRRISDGYHNGQRWVDTSRTITETHTETYRVPRTRTTPPKDVPEENIIYEFSGQTYKNSKGATGIFYYNGDRIELIDGTVLWFSGGVITDGEKHQYTKQ